jgi:excisionase family DNA binding protein
MTTEPRRLVPDEWLTPDEICTELKISRRTWDRLHASGEGPRFKKVGREIRVRRSWLETWLDDSEASA